MDRVGSVGNIRVTVKDQIKEFEWRGHGQVNENVKNQKDQNNDPEQTNVMMIMRMRMGH